MEMNNVVLPSSLRGSDYSQFLVLLKERVCQMFPENPMIVPIKFTEETVSDNGINFNIKLLNLLTKKPTATKDTFSPLITKDN